MTYSAFHDLVLTFSEVSAVPHFKLIGYKVTGKRMICTYNDQTGTANIFLTPDQQATFCNLEPDHIYPVPNKWGEKGATTFDIEQIQSSHIQLALKAAYENVVNK